MTAGTAANAPASVAPFSNVAKGITRAWTPVRLALMTTTSPLFITAGNQAWDAFLGISQTDTVTQPTTTRHAVS